MEGPWIEPRPPRPLPQVPGGGLDTPQHGAKRGEGGCSAPRLPGGKVAWPHFRAHEGVEGAPRGGGDFNFEATRNGREAMGERGGGDEIPQAPSNVDGALWGVRGVQTLPVVPCLLLGDGSGGPLRRGPPRRSPRRSGTETREASLEDRARACPARRHAIGDSERSVSESTPPGRRRVSPRRAEAAWGRAWGPALEAYAGGPRPRSAWAMGAAGRGRVDGGAGREGGAGQDGGGRGARGGGRGARTAPQGEGVRAPPLTSAASRPRAAKRYALWWFWF
jgi:hypothetical protein